jgi:hypothetical protein
MNILKNMEASFLFSLSVAGVASIAVDAIPPAQAREPVRAAAVNGALAQPGIPTVHVHAKRMSDAEKQQSLAQERSRQGV